MAVIHRSGCIRKILTSVSGQGLNAKIKSLHYTVHCTAQTSAKTDAFYVVQCSVSENNQMQKINWHTLHYNALQRIFEEEKKGLR